MSIPLSPKIPLWLDCDPGHDAHGYLYRLWKCRARVWQPVHRGALIDEIRGPSRAHQLTDLISKTTMNAASILTSISKHNEIPVYAGASHALTRPPMHHPTDIHGESGLDGTELLPQPLVKPNTTRPAVDAMAEAILAEAPNTVHVIATGAFTNVAALFQAHPNLKAHVKAVSVGDEERIGNYNPWAEFNIIADPEAAAFLCDDPVISQKLTFIPLDLTHQVLATEQVRDLLLYGEGGPKTGAGKTTLRQMLVELLMFFAKTYADVFGITDGPPLHDPLAVAVALIGTPHEIAFRDFDAAAASSGSVKYRERFAVKVETEGSYADAVEGKTQTGRTICKKLEAGSAGVAIPRGIDVPKFWKVLEECIQRADEANAGAVKGLAEKGPLHA
ncbi:uridine nucleosidase [Verticillium alfalfae VaMs.102]|uniref:Uridine nucleosidase n=1 Tax=Verticillium alfalfae (strain VaMs.102 / ATCC MYA-4576 / FGSC 10136) TaxID=526221 RepID=C9SHT4_VERA1|nr:uridine nucleosidase [Verticillium alfalfae VaMs.102]EEY18507.1 uridine nucleosidase [Verticillium alfalfae VaMs.102]